MYLYQGLGMQNIYIWLYWIFFWPPFIWCNTLFLALLLFVIRQPGQAINLNSAKHIKRALIAAPRKRRAMAMLKVTVSCLNSKLLGTFWLSKLRKSDIKIMYTV